MKLLTIYFTLAIIFLATHVTNAQDPLSKIQSKLMSDTNTIGLFIDSNKKASDFYGLFQILQEGFYEANKLNGELVFGFNGNSTSRQELFKLNSGINISRGKYPYQISFKSQLNIQLQNGKLQENLSNLQISYDRYFKHDRDPIMHEWFIFMNRASNQFMGVNQRYETGIGYVMNFWKKEDAITGDNDGKESKKTIDTLNSSIYNLSDHKIIFCSDTLCSKKTSLNKSELELIIDAKRTVVQSLRIKETKFRFALLAGLFYEAESMSFSDSLLTSAGMESLTHDFEATNNFRMEFRPTFDFNLSYLELQIRPYFKLPLASSWFVERDGRSVYDMRFELPVTLSIKISDGFSMGIEYLLFHDQAPNSYLSSDFLAVDNQPLYLTTSRNNHVTSLSVKYTF